MFGNLFGDLEKKQADMASKAAEIIVEAETSGIKVTANGAKEIVNIAITDPSVLSDREQLEDILVGVINRALADAGAKSAAEMEKMMASMMPPGFEDMLKGGGFPQ